MTLLPHYWTLLLCGLIKVNLWLELTSCNKIRQSNFPIEHVFIIFARESSHRRLSKFKICIYWDRKKGERNPSTQQVGVILDRRITKNNNDKNNEKENDSANRNRNWHNVERCRVFFLSWNSYVDFLPMCTYLDEKREIFLTYWNWKCLLHGFSLICARWNLWQNEKSRAHRSALKNQSLNTTVKC